MPSRTNDLRTRLAPRSNLDRGHTIRKRIDRAPSAKRSGVRADRHRRHTTPGDAPIVTPNGASERNAKLAIALAACLFGTTGSAQAIGPSTSPLVLGALRVVVAAIVLGAFLPRRRHEMDRASRHLVTVGAAGLAAYQPGFFIATQRSGVAFATVVALASGPVFMVAIDWISRRRRPPRRWMYATLVTTAGVVVLTFAPAAAAATPNGIGIAGSLTAGLGYAMFAASTKRLVERGVHSAHATAAQFAVAAVLLVPFIVADPPQWALRPAGMLLVAHLGVAATAIPYALYGRALRSIDAQVAVSLTLLEPLAATVVAAIILGESLTPVGWVAGGVVLAGMYVTAMSRGPREPRSTGRRGVGPTDPAMRTPTRR